MRLDRANRSFFALTATAVVLGCLSSWGALAGVLEPMIRTRADSGDGIASLIAEASLALLTSVAAISAALGFRTAARQAIASLKLSRRVQALRLPLTDELVVAAADTPLVGRVVLVDVAAPTSYVYGALVPRVVVSRGLLAVLSAQQLRAVLEHERYHVVNLDPLKLAIIRVIRSILFMLPALETLHRRYLTDRELAADRSALTACGRGPLAAALHKVADDPDSRSLAIGAAIADCTSLATRIRQLETGGQPRGEALGRLRLVYSLAVLISLTAAFLGAVWTLGGPATLRESTGTGLAPALLLTTATCAVPFTIIGLLAYTAIALRARKPLPPHRRRGGNPQTRPLHAPQPRIRTADTKASRERVGNGEQRL